MDKLLKIAVIGIVGVLLAIMLKGTRPEFSMYIALGTSVVLLFYAVAKLEIVIDTMNRIQDYIHLSSTYMSVLLKIIGITYIAEFAAGICKDAGYQAVAGQIEVFGKLSVLAVSMPILLALLDTINGLIG